MLKLHDLYKVYRTDEVETVALNGVNFEIEQGDFVAVMGPSGCGKSTLLNIVGLLDNLTEGSYSTRIYLTRGGNVVDVFETAIDVRKVGIERWLFNLAHEKPLAYGLLSLFIAIVAGWSASAVFQYIRS